MTRRKPRFCPCGANISHRGHSSKRCEPCQYVRDIEMRHARYLRDKATDPAYLTNANAAKKTWYRRKKQTGVKLHIPRFQQCPRCKRMCRTDARKCSVCGQSLEGAKVLVGRRNQQAHGVPVMREGR